MANTVSSDYAYQSQLVNENWLLISTNWASMDFGNAACWKFTSNGQAYFLKQMRIEAVGSEDRIKDVLSAQIFFAKGGLPVVRPFPIANGDLYLQKPEGFYTLTPFIPYIQVSKADLTESHIISLAQTLAKMHLHGSSGELSISKVFNGWKDPQKVQELIAKLRETIAQRKVENKFTELDDLVLQELKVKEKILQKVVIKYIELGLQSDHLTHGDFHERNIFFNNNQQVAAVIDFDTVEMAPRSREVARACDLLCLDRKDFGKDSLKRAKLFITEYNRYYPIDLEELKKGWRTHLMKNVTSLFAYTEYYYTNGKNAEQFIRNEQADLLDYYWNNMDEIVENIYV